MAPEKKENQIFENGFWIKEQQGVLTIGTVHNKGKDVMIVPQDIAEKLYAVEADMIDALYGETKKPFKPGVLDVDILFSRLKKKHDDKPLKLSFSDPEKKPFYCEFDPIFTMLDLLIISSATGSSVSAIYISASITQDHLCIVYRASESIIRPSLLTPEFHQAGKRINGRVNYKKSGETSTYYEIMIQSSP